MLDAVPGEILTSTPPRTPGTTDATTSAAVRATAPDLGMLTDPNDDFWPNAWTARSRHCRTGAASFGDFIAHASCASESTARDLGGRD